MKKTIDNILARPVATGIVVCAITASIVKIIRTVKKSK